MANIDINDIIAAHMNHENGTISYQIAHEIASILCMKAEFIKVYGSAQEWVGHDIQTGRFRNIGVDAGEFVSWLN